MGLLREVSVRPLKLDSVKSFLEVAKHGSFTTAARVLNLTQPAITHQVRELEQRFQTALFERVGNRVHLTSAGEKLAEHARPLIEQDLRTRTAMRRFVEGLVQRIRIGSSMTILNYVLPALLRKLNMTILKLRSGSRLASQQRLFSCSKKMSLIWVFVRYP